MSDDLDDLDDYKPSSSGLGDMVLPLVVAFIAFGLGLGVGWVVHSPEQVEVMVPRDLTTAELEAACAPSIADTARGLEEAHEKVRNLNTDLATKEAKVAELETEMNRRSDAGRALVAELARAKAELEDVRAQLVVAEEEQVRLVQELTVTTALLEKTEVKLEEQVVKTEHAQEDALTNKWYRFINDSQLEICERGNRKKLGKCRETVTALLTNDEIRNKFSHCVRSRQATPLVRIIDKGAQLPQFSAFLNQDDRIVKDWYLDLCDPTLPEAEDGFWDEDHLPKTDQGALDDF